MADQDKVAMVTGGARGIGLEITRELLALGMKVVAVDLREDLLAAMADQLGDPGDKLVTRAQDVTDSAGFTALIDDVVEKLGRLDVLVNNAGITRDGLLMRMEDSDWDLVIKVNLTSAFYGTRAASKHMIRQRGGSIINMASYSGVEGNRGQAN